MKMKIAQLFWGLSGGQVWRFGRSLSDTNDSEASQPTQTTVKLMGPASHQFALQRLWDCEHLDMLARLSELPAPLLRRGLTTQMGKHGKKRQEEEGQSEEKVLTKEERRQRRKERKRAKREAAKAAAEEEAKEVTKAKEKKKERKRKRKREDAADVESSKKEQAKEKKEKEEKEEEAEANEEKTAKKGKKKEKKEKKHKKEKKEKKKHKKEKKVLEVVAEPEAEVEPIEETEKPPAEEEEEPPKKKRRSAPNRSFQRIRAEDITFLKTKSSGGQREDWRLQNDGTVHVTEWGSRADNTLRRVKGRNFRHEKTKRKRGTYRGGKMDTDVRSIKFDVSDSE